MSELVPEVKHRTVVDGVISHLSASSIQSFDSTEEGCHLKFWFAKVQGRKEPQRAWQEIGDSVDQQITHYLGTSEDVLGSIARPGIEFLPAPGKGLLLQWGLNHQPRPIDPETKKFKSYFPPEQSLVHAAGIPLIGFTDILNEREEYLVPTDEYGEHVELRKEPGVVEIIDVKTTKSFTWTKSHEELRVNTQMLVYGQLVAAVAPDATHVRLSHNAFLTEGSPKAIKRSVLVPMSECRSRWGRVEGVAAQMKVVAAAKNEREVEGNLEACKAFGGCAHRTYCHAYKNQNPLRKIKMGLLKNRQTPAPTNGAPPQNGIPTNTPWTGQPVSTASQAMQMPAQNFQPLQPPPQAAPQPVSLPPALAQAPQAPQLPPGWLFAKDAIQGEAYFVNNVLTMFLSGTSGRQSFMPIVNGQLSGTPLLIEYGAFINHAPGQAPRPQVQQPQVQREPTAPPAPAPLAAQVQVPSFAPGAPAAAPTFAPGQQTPAPEAPKRARRTKAEMEAARAVEGQPAPTPRNGQGISLFVNAIPNDPFTDLSGYVAEATQALQEQFGVVDIRVAPDASPLAFARWRGMLSQVVKQDPPPAGTYVAFTRGNELTEVVVEALAPLCGPGQLIRGV